MLRHNSLSHERNSNILAQPLVGILADSTQCIESIAPCSANPLVGKRRILLVLPPPQKNPELIVCFWAKFEGASPTVDQLLLRVDTIQSHERTVATFRGHNFWFTILVQRNE